MSAPTTRPGSGPTLSAIADVDHDAGLATTIAEHYAAGGPPMMHQLGLRIVAAHPGRVRFEVDVTDHVTHSGGVLCGQAIMACMDTGMVFAMASLTGGEMLPFTTVSLNTVFERGIPADCGTATFEATIVKPGRSLVFGEIGAFLPDGRRAATATTTYMWLPVPSPPADGGPSSADARTS